MKTAENVLSQIAVLVSPKNKRTPFAEFEIVKIVGTCWESNPERRGKQCSVMLVLSSTSTEHGSAVRITGTEYLLTVVWKRRVCGHTLDDLLALSH